MNQKLDRDQILGLLAIHTHKSVEELIEMESNPNENWRLAHLLIPFIVSGHNSQVDESTNTVMVEKVYHIGDYYFKARYYLNITEEDIMQITDISFNVNNLVQVAPVEQVVQVTNYYDIDIASGIRSERITDYVRKDSRVVHNPSAKTFWGKFKDLWR